MRCHPSSSLPRQWKPTDLHLIQHKLTLRIPISSLLPQHWHCCRLGGPSKRQTYKTEAGLNFSIYACLQQEILKREVRYYSQSISSWSVPQLEEKKRLSGFSRKCSYIKFLSALIPRYFFFVNAPPKQCVSTSKRIQVRQRASAMPDINRYLSDMKYRAY